MSSSPITFGGLASGLDTNSIVTKLVQVERQPITTLQTKKAAEQAQKTLIADISTKLTTLSTSMDGLKTQAGVLGRGVIVSSDAPFTAQVSGGAPLGSYSVVVNQLAQAQRTYSNTFAGADTAGLLGAGTLTLGVGTASAKVSVTAADTLSTVASKINAAGLRVDAAVVYDGANYRLVLNGLDTGQKNAVTISDSGTGLGLDVAKNTVVSAQDAQLTIDGLSVSSSSNTVTGSIPAVTLTLTGTTKAAAGPSSVSVTSDPAQLKTALKAVADNYNAVMTVVNKQFATDGKTQLGPETLAGDGTTQQLQFMLLGVPTQSGGPAGNLFRNLAEIGLTVDRYGSMSFDSTVLDKALAKDPDAVARLLAGTGSGDGLVKGIQDSIKTYTDFVSGALTVKSQSLDTSMSNIDAEISRLDAAATTYESNLRQQFSQMEQLIASYQNQTQALSSFSGLTFSTPGSNNTSGK